mgnify:CR=1 FL=1
MNHSDQTKQITAQTEKMLIDQYERLYRLAYSYVHNCRPGGKNAH